MEKHMEEQKQAQQPQHSTNQKLISCTPSTNNSTNQIKNKKILSENLSNSLASNCQIISHIKQLTVINQSLSQRASQIEPIKGLYYKNRSHFFNWLRNQSVKLQLSRQCFGGALFMMDYYFKQNDFNSDKFACQALTMLIISSKINQSKVLYTPIMAKKIKVDPLRMQETQIQIMKWFKYKINAYNFARVIMNHMKVWDDLVRAENLQSQLPIFFQQKLSSYMLFQQLFYVCEQQLKTQNQLLSSTIKLIFQQIFISESGYQNISKYLNKLFSLKQQLSIFYKQEFKYAYVYVNQQSQTYPNYVQTLKQKIQVWRNDFKNSQESFKNKFSQYLVKRENYSIFIGAQI